MKPSNEPAAPAPADDDERPIGELVHELIEDGKAYARAEFGVAKAMASAKADALKMPAILFGAALLVLQGAINALAVGVGIALARFIGPLGGGIAAFLIFAGLSGGLAWFGIRKLREGL